MPAYNNAIQRPHLRKHYQKWIKTWFNQPARKFRRISKRRDLAESSFPRPIRKLQPEVSKPTFRYTGQRRLGRGFSLQELAEVKLNPAFARTIGVRVDHRRTNKSVESLQRNVKRLKAYLAKLVLLPRKADKPKKGTWGRLGDKAEKVELTQEARPEVLDAQRASRRVKGEKISAEQSKFRAHAYLRLEMAKKRLARKKASDEKKAEKK